MTLEQKGFNRIVRLRGRSLQMLSGPDVGKSFLGTINRIGAFELTTSLSNDPRGKRILEVPADSCPNIARTNRVQDTANGESYVVVNVGLDSPDYSKKFELQQMIEKDI